MKTENKKKKIAIMGGSFDPCHRGHINLAIDAKNQMNLDKVVFVPTKIQPFKLGKAVAPDKDRINMLKLAIDKIEGLEISDIEISKNEVSYTYNTLRKIKKNLGDEYKIYFLVGTDAFLQIESWNKADELLRENCFLVGSRIGYKSDELEKVIKRVKEKYGCEVILVDNRRFHNSSTEIRNRVLKNLSLSDLVGKEVDRYINENGLYR